MVDRRVGILFALFLGLLAVAGTRAAWLATVKARSLKHAASSQQTAQLVVPARRGAIVDRNGVELAVSQPADDVSATPYLVKDPVAAARKLAPLVHRDEDELVRTLARRDTGFVYLARRLPADEAQRISALKLAGVDLTPTTRRVYPRDWMATQLLGTVGTDGNGLSGLEYRFDRVLHGTDGNRTVVKNGLGQPIAVHDIEPALSGEPLQLSLDSAIQDKAEAVLSQIGSTYRPNGATAIVMDPRDSALLAVANWPRVDANDVGGAPAYARRDLAVEFVYEPGSTFMAIAIAGALQDGIVAPGTQFVLAPTIQVAERTFGEAEGRGAVTLSTAQILARSSNVGAITIGLRAGADRFSYWVHRFGFGRRTGVDLPGEEVGLVLPRDKYSGSSMGDLPIGRGESVTPLQIATAYSAIANGGILRPPHIVRRVGGKLVPEPKGHRIISGRTAQELRTMLEVVRVPGSTASEDPIPGYKLAGKTATAYLAVNGEYSSTKYVSSFVGFAPAEHPRLLVSVLVDEPRNGKAVAATASRQIAAYALRALGTRRNSSIGTPR